MQTENTAKLESKTLSVIVPVYNTEDFLPRCLDSLVGQSLESIEILVVNDGSPDNSQMIIDRYQERYPEKITAYAKENGGLSDARNFGMQRASGEYIAFLDSDDYVDFDMYERLYSKAVETSSDVVCSGIAYYFADRVEKRFVEEQYFGLSVRQSPQLLYTATSFAGNKIFRRSIWEENGFEFSHQWFEDSALIYNVMLAANRVECVNIPMMNYYKDRDGSITNSLDDERVFDIFTSCESIIDYYSNAGVFDDLKEQLEHVCLVHLYARIDALSLSPNRVFARRFVKQARSFLGDNFPDWQNSSFFKTTARNPFGRAARHLSLLDKALLLPGGIKFLKKAALGIVELLRRSKRLAYAIAGKRSKAKQNAKSDTQHFIQKNGAEALVELQKTLTNLNIPCFADFGTLLGLVREGEFLAHDLDVDVGAMVKGDAEKRRIRAELERAGFELYRQYLFEDSVVEESYVWKQVKLDIHYYSVAKNGATTYLFYRKKKSRYFGNVRDVVEMSYSPIGKLALRYMPKLGAAVYMPENAEQLLEEKYGQSWRIPDSGWIYWRSPASKPLDEVGRFRSFRYFGSIEVSTEEEYSQNNEQQLKMIRKLQLETLRVLEEIKRVCQKLDIAFYLGEGTLLGAIREKGIIPWDDDIDILMPRDDYERFLAEAPKVMSNDFGVQHSTLVKNYWSAFMKVRLVAPSDFSQTSLKGITEYRGPYVDIFPLDSVPARSSKKQNRQKLYFAAYRKMLSLKVGDTGPKTLQAKMIYPLCKIVSVKTLNKKIEKSYRKYEGVNNRYIVNLASYYDVRKQTFPKEYYGNPRMFEFEGELYPVPNRAEDILSSIFGNYNKLPPQSLRNSKHSMEYSGEDIA